MTNNNTNLKEEITLEDFSKVDLRVGTILICERIPKSDKLLKLEVDFGDLGKRQILSGIGKWYTPEELIGFQTLFVVNIRPRAILGYESQGMIMAAGLEDNVKPIFFISKEPLTNGEGVR